MSDSLPSDLAGFLDEVEGDPPDHSMLVVNRSEPEPLQRLLEGAFEGQPVDIEDPV